MLLLNDAMKSLRVLAYRSVSGGTASAFSLPDIPAAALAAYVTCENQAARWRIDGGDPTDSDGHLLPVGGDLVLYRDQVWWARLRSTSTQTVTTLRVTYFG